MCDLCIRVAALRGVVGQTLVCNDSCKIFSVWCVSSAAWNHHTNLWPSRTAVKTSGQSLSLDLFDVRTWSRIAPSAAMEVNCYISCTEQYWGLLRL